MTIADKIDILDNAIVRMNTYLSFGSSYSDHLYDCGKSVMKDAVDTLEEIDAPHHSIYSIQTVSFESCRKNVLGGHMAGEYETMCANKCNAYKQSVNSVISILNQERSRLVKEQQDEDQKKSYDAQIASNKLQQESIMWGKIAAFASIASIIVTIILYLCKN